MKNWFGIEGHPTDSLIHWRRKQTEAVAMAKEFRAAYGKIASAGFEKELTMLMRAATEAGRNDVYDDQSDI